MIADRVPDPRPHIVHALPRSELEDPVPDATTIWLFREALAEAGLIDRLFERFGLHLEVAGYIVRGGQIIDATIVSVHKQRSATLGC
jgi:IS5 family transposase